MTGRKCMVVLKALSEIHRLRIVRLLTKGRRGVGEITRRLRIPQYNVSKHLRVLRQAGLLDMERAGKRRLYRLAPDLERHLAARGNVLKLACCTFRLDRLPK